MTSLATFFLMKHQKTKPTAILRASDFGFPSQNTYVASSDQLLHFHLRPCLHKRKWNGSKTSHLSIWYLLYVLFGSATEVVPFRTVSFGSRVNGQNRLEPSLMRTLRKRGYYKTIFNSNAVSSVPFGTVPFSVV